jgi:hypothetical protein
MTSRLYITITKEPLHEAIAGHRPAVETIVVLGETTATALMQLMKESRKYLEDAHEEY